MNLAKFFLNGEVSDVPLAPDATTAFWSSSLTMPAGKYVFAGVGYDCTRRGRYLFWDGYGAPIHARLVHHELVNGVRVDPDLYAFLSGLSWHHVHATNDEGFATSSPPNWQGLANACMNHKVRLRCGYLVGFARWLLGLWGYQTRAINLITLEAANGVNDGHIVLEVQHGGKWKLWDLSNGCYFVDAMTGEHLNAAEIVQRGVLNCARIAIDRDEKRGSSVADGWDFQCYRDMALLTPEGENTWFSRIYQSWVVG